MEDREDDRFSFSRFLNRGAAEKDLRVREKLAVMSRLLTDAPVIRPLTNLWTDPEEVIIGGWLKDIECLRGPLPKAIDSWSFWGVSLSEDIDLHRLRKVKLKVDKPFVISVTEPDDYQLHQLRVLGGDAVFLSVSHKEVAEIQYLTEVSRDLGMQTILWCEDFASLKKVRPIDAGFLSCPLSLLDSEDFKTASHRKLPIFYLESLLEIERLSSLERPFGVFMDERILDHDHPIQF